jgi:type I restriction enzyme S subunit
MTATLGGLCEAIVDCEHKTAPPGDGYALSVGTRAMKNGRLLTDACKPVSQATYEAWTRRMRPKVGDLILAREAPVGQVVLVPENQRLCLGQRTVLIRPDGTKVHPRFLHYWLLGPDAQGTMAAQAGGATVAHLNVEDIRALDVSRLPIDVHLQNFAAAALGTLDDLIENNRRRIDLLEQVAEAIYREWFVRFRYPGHEEVALVGSALGPIPEDWEVRQLREVSSLVRGRSYRKHELVESGGVPFVNLKCMLRGGGFRRDGLKRYDGVHNPDQRVRSGDIVLAVTDLTQGREILAKATLVPRLGEGFGVISLDVARIVPDEAEDRLALFFALRCTDFSDRVKEYANGSTVLHLSPTHVAEGLIVWPPQALRRRFVGVVEAMVDQAYDLNDAAERLSEMRDMLLPKLVGGQIDVSAFDFDAPVDSLA